jgi:lipase chaperone LimK
MAIDARADADLTQKLSMYKQSLKNVYGEQTEAYLERHRQESMNRFLDLSSVQRELTAMSPEARSQSLRTIRKELGLDEEALKRWDELDRTRDMRWQAGAAYMAEREALSKQFSGPELEAKVQELRARFFGAEADIIAQEEATGFFRFERPRQWGRN